MTESLTVYRRDHCGYCRHLEHVLKSAGVAYERRDIWADPDAAAFVRSVNNGSETVPTVVFGNGDVRTNPKPKELLRELGIEPPSWRDRFSRHGEH